MATAALGARQLFAVSPGLVTGKPLMKVGVLSDIHVRDDTTQKIFIHALEWYRDKGVDAVLVAGDMADRGLIAEMKLVADAWFKVFPNGKAPDGRPVTQLFEYGNHCVSVANWGNPHPDPAERLRRSIKSDVKGWWERLFHEPYEPVFMKNVKGFQFVGAHWTGLDAREAWFAAHAKEINPSLPFFFFQHPHPKDTCYGSWAWGHDDGTSTRLLTPLTNAIALSGHSHYTLTDEKTVWQGAFTSVGTSSLSYSSVDYNYRENMPGNSCGTREQRPHTMRLDTSDGKQGMLFTVCEDHIRIERREFVWDQSLGDDWILPVGKGAAKPFEYAKRKSVRTAPEFAPGATAKVEIQPVKTDKDGKPEPGKLAVTFPAAKTRNGCRVFEYEVQAVVLADDVEIATATRRVIAPDFHWPLSKAGKDGICLFNLADLPKDTNIRFDVRPIECFGKKGEAISTPVFTTPNNERAETT